MGVTGAFVEEEVICGKGKEKCILEALNKIKDVDSVVPWEELVFDLPPKLSVVIETAHSSYLNRCTEVEAQTFIFHT